MENLSYMIKSILIVRLMFFKINLQSICLKMFKQWWYKFKYVIVHIYWEIKVHIHYFACGFFNVIVQYKVHIKLTIHYFFPLLKDFMFSHNLVLFVIFNKNYHMDNPCRPVFPTSLSSWHRDVSQNIHLAQDVSLTRYLDHWFQSILI